VSISVGKCSWVKCGEVLQCSYGLRNKVSNIIRRHTDNMKLLLVCIVLLSHSLMFIRLYFFSMYVCIYGCIAVQYCNLCVFYCYVYLFLLYVYVSSSCQLALFGYSD
jgi:hypothetical protein